MLGLLVLARAPIGLAQGPQATQRALDPAAAGTLALDTQACAEAWADGLERLVRIELGATPDRAQRGALAVSVRCADDRVVLHVAQGGTTHATERNMNLAATDPSVRARVVALAIAGLARELALISPETPNSAQPATPPPTAQAQTETQSQIPSPSQSQTPSRSPSQTPSQSQPIAIDDAPRPAESEHAHVVEIDLLLAAGNFAASNDLVWSGGARVHYLGLRPWHIALDVQAGAYARDTALGTAHLLSGSLGARLGFMFGSGDIALTAGAGERLGLARASATTTDRDVQAGSVLGVWTAPIAFLSFDAAVFGHFRFGVDGELGAVVLPVRGRIEQGSDIAVDGLWLAIALTFGMRF